MKKKIILAIMILFLTGCSVDYEINFGEKDISEQIKLTYNENLYDTAKKILEDDGFYLEKELIESEMPSLVGYEDYYNKDIKVKKDKTTVTLDYRYSYDNFENSYAIEQCFEKSTFINDKEYYYLSLGGIFSCTNTGEITLKMKSDYKIIKDNAHEVKEGYRIWKIGQFNDDKEIVIQLSKELIAKEQNKSIFDFKFFIGCALILIVAVFFIIKKKLTSNM